MFKGLSENQRALLVTIGLVVSVFATLYFATYFAGIFGLTVEAGGIYADCSKERNRNNPYCQPKEAQSEKEWRNIGGKGKSVQFSLH